MSVANANPGVSTSPAPTPTSEIALGRTLLTAMLLAVAVSALGAAYTVRANAGAPRSALGQKDTPVFTPFVMAVQVGFVMLLAIAAAAVGNVAGACVTKASGRRWRGAVSGVAVGLLCALVAGLVMSPDDLPPITDGKPVATVGYFYPILLAATCAVGGFVGVKSSPARQA